MHFRGLDLNLLVASRTICSFPSDARWSLLLSPKRSHSRCVNCWSKPKLLSTEFRTSPLKHRSAKLKRAYHGDNPAQGIRMPEMQRKETHALSFDPGRDVLLHLTGEPALLGGEVLQPHTLVVRENFYRGKFGSVKAKSRRRAVPLSRSVVEALVSLRARGKFTGPDDLVFASREGTPLNENKLPRRIIKPVAVKLGIPWLSGHVFRIGMASLTGRHRWGMGMFG